MRFRIGNNCRTLFTRGFIATISVTMLAVGALAFMVSTMSSVWLYADSVEQRQRRLQRSLNLRACDHTLPILVAKDHFFTGDVYLSDLDCSVNQESGEHMSSEGHLQPRAEHGEGRN